MFRTLPYRCYYYSTFNIISGFNVGERVSMSHDSTLELLIPFSVAKIDRLETWLVEIYYRCSILVDNATDADALNIEEAFELIISPLSDSGRSFVRCIVCSSRSNFTRNLQFLQKNEHKGGKCFVTEIFTQKISLRCAIIFFKSL